MFKAEFKIEGLEEAKKLCSTSLMRKSLRSTLDKSTTKARQAIVKEVTSTHNIAGKDVRAAMTTLRTTADSLETGVQIKGPRLSLLYFKAKQGVLGVTAKVRKDHDSFYRSAFIVTKWGKVMVRTGKSRLPIQHKAGPSVPMIVDKEPLLNRVRDAFHAAFDRLFGEEVDKRTRA